MSALTEDRADLIREHQRLLRVLRSPSHADDLREAQRQAKELREYRQKERVKNWPLKKPASQGRPAVTLGDELYFQHPQHGPISGKVLCHGAHGVTLECARGQHHQVRWDRLLGAKQRLAQDFAMVEQGEDGAVLEDAQGQRRFLQWPVQAATDLKENENEKAEAPLKKAVFFFKSRRFKGQPGYELQAHRYHSIRLRYRQTQKSADWVRHRGLYLPKGGSPDQRSSWPKNILTDADLVKSLVPLTKAWPFPPHVRFWLFQPCRRPA